MDLSPVSRDVLRQPAPMRLVFGALVIAIVLSLLPWSGWALKVRPDFVLLVLLYWTVHEPQHIGQTWGFMLGLLMDVADSALLGQHALVYVMAIFLTQLLRIRIRHLTLIEQAVHILGILLVAKVIAIGLNLSLGREFAGMTMFLAPVLGALMWMPVHFLATRPRFRRRGETIML